jgi:hypothetical protein
MSVAVTGRDDMARLLAALPGLGGRQALDNAIAGQHAPIYGKVPAHHEGPHGCVLLGQGVRLVRIVRLIMAPIDQDEAGVAAAVLVALV